MDLTDHVGQLAALLFLAPASASSELVFLPMLLTMLWQVATSLQLTFGRTGAMSDTPALGPQAPAPA
jgi:hypothetical protein